MHNFQSTLESNLIQLPVLLLFVWIAYRRIISRKPLPGSVRFAGRVLRVILVLVTFGLLAGCGSSDPLPIASGPLFQLNPGHWQPSPQDLAAPPSVTD